MLSAKRLTLFQTAEILNQALPKKISDFPFNRVSTDSRNCQKGDLFIALKGDQFNGYDYVTQAVHNKAAAVIVSKNDHQKRPLRISPKIPLFTVRDTTKAYGKLADFQLTKFRGTRIALTGSSGKTTTRELLKVMLQADFKVFTNQKNHNNQIGVPKTIFNIDRDYDYYIFELGMNHKNEIAYLSKLIRPQLSVITNISNAHLKYFKNVKEIARAKAEIFEGQPDNGITFLNSRDTFLDFLSGLAQKRKIKIKKFTPASLKYSRDNRYLLNAGKKYRINFRGKYNLENTACALKIAGFCKISKEQALKQLSRFQGEKSRFQIHNGKPLLIDDSYNANPDSTLKAITEVINLAGRKKLVLILADMLELGKNASRLHREVLEKTAALIKKRKGETEFILKGKQMAGAAEVLKGETIQIFQDNDKIKNYLLNNFDRGKIYFFKGSNGMRLFKLVEDLKCYTT